MRVRSALAYATHQFFQEAGFQYLHTPILSAADCEGAGELFQVSGAPNPSICVSLCIERTLTKDLCKAPQRPTGRAILP